MLSTSAGIRQQTDLHEGLEMLAILPRTAWFFLPTAGIITAGFDYWSQSGLSLHPADIPMAVIVAIVFVGVPGFFLGLGLLAADYAKPQYRSTWIAIEAALFVVMILAGLSLGPQMDF